jgi:hypothetical protein
MENKSVALTGGVTKKGTMTGIGLGKSLGSPMASGTGEVRSLEGRIEVIDKSFVDFTGVCF